MNKSAKKEKSMIMDSVSRRPYGVKLSVMLDISTRMKFNGEVCLLTDKDYIIKMRPTQSQETSEADSELGIRAWDFIVEGFSTAGEAERKGLEIAFGILWGAISEGYSISLQYQTPLPCVVYDRTGREPDIFINDKPTVIQGKPLSRVTTSINEGFQSDQRGNEKLLLAMELFSSAQQERTERSRFIGLVSSLEPLAEQQSYGSNLTDIINRFKDQIKGFKLPPYIEASLLGRIENLLTESVSSAIQRIIKECLPGDDNALKIIEEAYDLRSRILHDGTTDADLKQKSQVVKSVIRRVIASKAGLNLRIP